MLAVLDTILTPQAISVSHVEEVFEDESHSTVALLHPRESSTPWFSEQDELLIFTIARSQVGTSNSDIKAG